MEDHEVVFSAIYIVGNFIHIETPDYKKISVEHCVCAKLSKSNIFFQITFLNITNFTFPFLVLVI